MQRGAAIYLGCASAPGWTISVKHFANVSAPAPIESFFAASSESRRRSFSEPLGKSSEALVPAWW